MPELAPVPERANALSYLVIGCAIDVHRALGPGFLESVYERALCVEFTRRGIPFDRQPTVRLQYQGEHVGELRLDLIVERLLIVELKCVDQFAAIHYAQTTSYLRATALPLALLLNFNVTSMRSGVRRVVNAAPCTRAL